MASPSAEKLRRATGRTCLIQSPIRIGTPYGNERSARYVSCRSLLSLRWESRWVQSCGPYFLSPGRWCSYRRRPVPIVAGPECRRWLQFVDADHALVVSLGSLDRIATLQDKTRRGNSTSGEMHPLYSRIKDGDSERHQEVVSSSGDCQAQLRSPTSLT